MFKVRHYRNEEFETIHQWWLAAREPAPLPGMMPPDSTFVVELNDAPIVAVTIYLTNTPEVAYVENLISSPQLDADTRALAVECLNAYIGKFARARGYKRLMCMSEKAALMKRYKELGYTKTLEGVATFIRELV
jgi:hypothetical protein